jgi:hypothetical protein
MNNICYNTSILTATITDGEMNHISSDTTVLIANFTDGELSHIQGVTGGMCHTSGGCSLC